MRRIITLILSLMAAAGMCACAAQPAAEQSTSAADPAASSLPSASETAAQPSDRHASSENSPLPLRWIMPTDYEMKELSVETEDRTLFGIAYIPETEEERVPLVIWSHGLGGTGLDGASYAGVFAGHGVACYCVDFYGGGPGSQSGGEMTEMSVMTEVSDLEAVIEAARGWDFADPGRIILAGQSQGGLVSAITAAGMPDDINGLILLYPAFVIPETVHELFGSPENVPETYVYNWITAGRKYAEDIWDLDVWDAIEDYKKPVLLLHGDADDIVDIAWSRRAREVYENARLFVFAGAGHRFTGDDFDEACEDIFDYLQETGLLTPEVFWRPRKNAAASAS